MKVFAPPCVVAALALQMSPQAFAADPATAGPGTASVQADAYGTTLATWTSYQDVADWLRSHFKFDHGRLNLILQRTRQNGPSGLLARSAGATFQTKSGYCTDSAAFAIQSLNQIHPGYNARYIFIKNRFGQPHHWVAGFMVDGKIMVLDYGASAEWAGMNGVHGPYDSLEQYAQYIGGLRIAKFSPESVEWRNVFPGQQD